MQRDATRAAEQECLRDWIGMCTGFLTSVDDPADQQLTRLSNTIESEIIPRLMMLLDTDLPLTGSRQRTGRPELVLPARSLLDEVDNFVAMVLNHDAALAIEYVERLRDSETTLPQIYLNLLAPAARKLGALWESDECSFTAVTIAVSRMHQVLLHYSPCFCAGKPEDMDAGHSALIVPYPGEQHTFGLFMVVEFFRRAGWNVWSGTPDSGRELLDLVRSNSFDVVGCSLSAERHLDGMPRQIREIRSASRNPDIRIIVGGRVFLEQPELVKTVGADASATDGEDAVRLADLLVRRGQ